MSTESLDVSVGARLWYQGNAWTVVEHDGSAVVLRSGEQLKRVHASSLIGLAESLEDSKEGRSDQDSFAELDAVVLASLTTDQRQDVEAEARAEAPEVFCRYFVGHDCRLTVA